MTVAKLILKLARLSDEAQAMEIELWRTDARGVTRKLDVWSVSVAGGTGNGYGGTDSPKLKFSANAKDRVLGYRERP